MSPECALTILLYLIKVHNKHIIKDKTIKWSCVDKLIVGTLATTNVILDSKRQILPKGYEFAALFRKMLFKKKILNGLEASGGNDYILIINMGLKIDK